MEFLKNLINPVTERVRSPFYGAFFISWLLVNWRIILAFFSDSLIIENQTKFSFIAEELAKYDRSILCPLLLALLYLFVMPYIDLFVYKHSEKVKAKKIQNKIAIGKKSNVSGETYYNIWDRYQKLKDDLGKALSELEKKESDFLKTENQLIESKKKNDFLSNQLQEKEHELTKFNFRSNLKEIFKGEWFHTYEREGKEYSEKLIIKGSNAYQISADGTEKLAFEIDNNFVDIFPERDSRKINFISITNQQVIKRNLLNQVDERSEDSISYNAKIVLPDGTIKEERYWKSL